MEDVLEVYARPYNSSRPVVCVDEVSKELHSTPHGQIAIEPGVPACVDYEYARHGTANLFMSVEPLAGRREVRVTDRRTAKDFAEELRLIVDIDYPDAEMVVLVSDNLNTHKLASLYEAFPATEARRIARKIEWHYTPEHGSWLMTKQVLSDIAECELSVLSRQCLDRRICDVIALQSEVEAWKCARNVNQAKVSWQFTAEDARIKLRRLYPALK